MSSRFELLSSGIDKAKVQCRNPQPNPLLFTVPGKAIKLEF